VADQYEREHNARQTRERLERERAAEAAAKQAEFERRARGE